ncbi:hypothetical protein Goshw_027786 [Gossypium schwendimanii]|uniref:Uncharacterized protein n=1 Tax=Gossypium schwendimanii TaxID=34291 RepID=A0A7J9KV06_GOSSC|nr:hypothetical protein [Gossypium schwendimanii]
MAFKTFTASIKLLIDQERNKVLLAEAGNDFIDTLRSLLKLPLGNIGLLFRKNKSLLTGCLEPKQQRRESQPQQLSNPCLCSCGKLMNSEIYLEEMERDGVKDENEGGSVK